MPNTNPYASADMTLPRPRSEPYRTHSMRRLVCFYVASFFGGCVLGTEVSYSLLLGGTLFGESILWQQSVVTVAINVATWLIASLCIAAATFAVFPSHSTKTTLFRGFVAGLVFAFPMFGTGWLAIYLAQRGSGLPGFLLPDSLIVRYIYYTMIAICFDVFTCAILAFGRRITKKSTRVAGRPCP